MNRDANPEFTGLPDLASRALGGAVVWANDEFFADKENLVNPEPPVFHPATFTPKGQLYDGWETRRRRPGAPGVAGTEHDSAIIRLAAPGLIRGVVVDTTHFLGNHPPRCSIDATWCAGHPSPKRLGKARWTELAPATALRGGRPHHIPVPGIERRFSHVRLNLLPDGGVARLRVHAQPLPDPAFLAGLTVNLAALIDGARVTACSDMYFGRAENMLMPGLARTMGDGWENARRRDGGNDRAEVRLIGEGVVQVLEIDTTHFKGNAPDRVRVSATRADGDQLPDEHDWTVLLPKTRLQPDAAHRFLIRDADPATHLRLDVYPDGGIARLRALGTLTREALDALTRRWQQTG
ncbi:allantoicase [Actinocrinis puniceicyclus]|uniref:Probable allantoicase n=1 Tax=Actinocrinis puniceicyclus TaxID=977794 RepID=A0A8J7WM88_9ACTN|nr:allantoicase [Actinocrinis puniceicyclus]MBS2964991.1 allantoicase [Actinocrinis puniceicyclus]